MYVTLSVSIHISILSLTLTMALCISKGRSQFLASLICFSSFSTPITTVRNCLPQDCSLRSPTLHWCQESLTFIISYGNQSLQGEEGKAIRSWQKTSLSIGIPWCSTRDDCQGSIHRYYSWWGHVLACQTKQTCKPKGSTWVCSWPSVLSSQQAKGLFDQRGTTGAGLLSPTTQIVLSPVLVKIVLWSILGKVNNLSCDFTIDTGGDISIIHPDMLTSDKRQDLLHTFGCSLWTVTFEKALIRGTVELMPMLGTTLVTHQYVGCRHTGQLHTWHGLPETPKLPH